jgi:hypothetical protein
MQMLRRLKETDPAAIAKRRRAFMFHFIGLGASFGLTFVIILSIALVFLQAAMLSTALAATHAPAYLHLFIGILGLGIIWAGQFFAGQLYMEFVSRLGQQDRKGTLTPIFIASLETWGIVTFIAFQISLFSVGTLVMVGGAVLHILGARRKMMQLRGNLPDTRAIPKITSQSEINIGFNELKTAESLEQLEQLSQQCLLALKPGAAVSSDYTSTLIGELMQRKLSAEADELSLLQLNLSEKD